MKDFPDPTKLVIEPTRDTAKVSWSAVGWVDLEYARKFAEDLLIKCNKIEVKSKGRQFVGKPV